MLSFFPLGVLDEIWDLIESVSEGFLAYSSMGQWFQETMFEKVDGRTTDRRRMPCFTIGSGLGELNK